MRRISSFLIFLSFIAAVSCLNGCTTDNNKDAANQELESVNAVNDSSEVPSDKIIIFFGNSLTAGYGLENTQSFPALIQQKIDSLGLSYKVINAGVSGETTATGSNRVKWVLEQQAVDIFVLELGANDGLRGVPVTETKSNLIKIIDFVHEVNPNTKIILAGMMIPPSMGPEYTNAFSKLFPEIATEKNIELIPFLLNGVAGIDSLNLDDGIHPNVEGQKIVAENVWEILSDILKENN